MRTKTGKTKKLFNSNSISLFLKPIQKTPEIKFVYNYQRMKGGVGQGCFHYVITQRPRAYSTAPSFLKRDHNSLIPKGNYNSSLPRSDSERSAGGVVVQQFCSVTTP